MQAQVDLREWAGYALRRSPALESGLLDFNPVMDVRPEETVFDVVSNALRTTTAKIRNEEIRGKLDRALDPFQPDWYFWVLGLPVQAFSADTEVHFFDRISELASTSGEAVLSVRPRSDISEKRNSLRAVGEKFAAAIGLGGMLEQIRDSVTDDFDKVLLGRYGAIVPAILARHDLAAYNEFAAETGSEFVQNYWMPCIYPSALWQEIQKGQGPIFLAEVGARGLRYRRLQSRVQITTDALSQGRTMDELWGWNLRGDQYLKPDEIMKGWFEKETVSLRYYLIGTLAFPESFLSLLKGEDIGNYKQEVINLLGRSRAEEGGRIVSQLLPETSSSPVNLTEVLKRFLNELPGGLGVLPGKLEVTEFIRAHKYLQQDLGSEKLAALILLYNLLRNKLVHGLNFKVEKAGTILFEHKGAKYKADYETLLLSFHLLPTALLTLQRSYRAHVT